MMRRVRDYDQELSALAERASQLKAQKLQRLGGLVTATGADHVGMEALAGALLFIAKEPKRGANQEAWRFAGANFFQHGGRKTSEAPRDNQHGADSGPAGNTQN